MSTPVVRVVPEQFTVEPASEQFTFEFAESRHKVGVAGFMILSFDNLHAKFGFLGSRGRNGKQKRRKEIQECEKPPALMSNSLPEIFEYWRSKESRY
jgi:hypothetical protein